VALELGDLSGQVLMAGKHRSNRAHQSDRFVSTTALRWLCKPFATSWERADYDDLYERCCLRSWVDDLAQLAGDTISDPAQRDEGFGYDL
jgi:hypothetical protein